MIATTAKVNTVTIIFLPFSQLILIECLFFLTMQRYVFFCVYANNYAKKHIFACIF